MTRYHTKNRHH